EARAVKAYGRELGTDPVSWTTWYGSLVRGRKDANGLTYLRNRYYDAATGQFTQPDPIGLAGGLNLYGYAGGDPINFSDPFGLAPCPPDDDCGALTAAMTVTGAAIGAFLGGGGGAVAGLACGPAAPACSTAAGSAGAAQGAAWGA